MSIAPSLCSTVSNKIKRCFRRRTKSSGPKVHEVVSPSRLSPEMEARVQGLPFMWRPKCRKALEGQTHEMQLVQIVIFESLPDYTKTACSPPESTIITELLVHAPKAVVEYELNLDDCANWFKGGEYDDEEEEEEEEFDDDALLWFPARWPREHVLPRTESPHRLRQVAAFNVVVEIAPVVPEYYTALPSPPSPSPALFPSPQIAKPLHKAIRTPRRNRISRAPARSAVPLPVLPQPSHATQTKNTANRPISYSGRCTSPSKPLRKHTLPMSDFRKLEDVTYDDFAQYLDERHKMFNGTRALGQLAVSVRPTQCALTKRKPVGSPARISNRPTLLSGRSISSKENWQQVEAAPLRKHIPSTLGDVIPRVGDAEFQWGHLAVDISYGTFANGLDERRMIIDDAFVTQDWD